MVLRDADHPVTEGMLQGSAVLPGRYGELQVEGFLTMTKDPVEVTVMLKVMPGLPLDLARFPSQSGLIQALVDASRP